MGLKLNRDELLRVIESLEGRGGDASELRQALTELPGARQSSNEYEELSPKDRLNQQVGDLFANGITDQLFAQLAELDGKYNLNELRDMCRKAGLSVSGDKKKLAAKLVARGILVVQEGEMESPKYVDLSKRATWVGPPDVPIAIQEAYLKPVKWEIVVFVIKERGGHDFMFQCREYAHLASGEWAFYHVLMDKSPKEQEVVQKTIIVYDPEIRLANVGFMAYPIPGVAVT